MAAVPGHSKSGSDRNPVISGTAVTDDLIDRTSTMPEAVELLYRLRQEIFIAEGRRMYDLGI